MRGRRSDSLKAELERAGDLIDYFVVLDEGYDTHLASATRAEQRACIIKFPAVKFCRKLQGADVFC